MKKYLARFMLVVFAVSCMVSFSACSLTVGTAWVHVFYYSYSDTYIANVRTALDKQLKDMDVPFQDYDGNGNQTTQTEQIQTAITNGAKVIVVNIVTTGSDDVASGIISMAKNAGIPVIFFNREVSDSVVKSYDKCVFIGTDAAEAGHLQGEMVGKYVDENFDKVDINGDGEISYVMFKGENGNNEAIFRTQYGVEDANKALTKKGRKPLKFYDPANADKYLVDKDGKWSAAAANEYMTTALTVYNESSKNMIELVICNNDGMAEGAVSALKGAGYNTGAKDVRTIPVFGVDATSAAKDLIARGQMIGTIKQDTDGMAKAIKHFASNVLNDMDIMHDSKNYTIDKNVNKIRIPYSIYMGE